MTGTGFFGFLLVLLIMAGALLSLLGGALNFADRTLLRDHEPAEGDMPRPGPRVLRLGLVLLGGSVAVALFVEVLARLFG